MTFEFNISNPGARSMALGGAFAALADDATAAFANPAGLTQLYRPELSAEGRSWSYDTPFVTAGRVSGSATGEGIDTADGLRFGRSQSDVTGLSFASFSYPGDRWSVALYRHTWADFSLNSQVNGLFGVEEGEDVRSEDVTSQTQFEVINTGVSGAYQITPQLSLGVGLAHYSAKMNSLSVEYALEDENFFQFNPYTDDLIDTTYTHRSNSSGVIANVGMLWKINENWSLGGYFRQGPELDLRVIEVTGPGQDELPPGTVEFDQIVPLQLPDVFGLGLAYRSTDGRWVVSGEWSHVGYSSISDSLDGRVFDQGQISTADADELHIGVEYVFIESTPIVALRLGAWHDPAHGVGSGPTAEQFERAIFTGGKSQTHFTTGVGLVFEKFQIDFGLSVSDSVDIASLSFVYGF
ncbi:MAG: hypothetical protein DHS20C11_22850 [Lysobacteraceae bacterium]|nr:MAG: hypothetical protein DHS20C11_22850 [Xanthomonadaceae bacterium]